MIISRTPLRISFVGGGTDLPSFYKKEIGVVVSASIQKYVYVLIHPFFHRRIQLKYSETETVKNVNDIKSPVFREVLRMFNIEEHVEISVVADIPKDGGSGLGGSTAFSTGLIHALSVFVNSPLNKVQCAEWSTVLEIGKLRNPIGKQDQYASALGGINKLVFQPDDSVQSEPIQLNAEVEEELCSNLLLFYTGRTRSANKILKAIQAQMSQEKTYAALRHLRDLAMTLYESMERNNIDSFGEMLHEAWIIKRSLVDGITDSYIDFYYKKALEAGADGGKILGAGGGGFLLFYCRKEYQEAVRESLRDLREFPISFDKQGTTIVLDDRLRVFQ